VNSAVTETLVTLLSCDMGESFVLHRDAVSGGGYFMLGTVVSSNMNLSGQLQPHQPARFVRIDMETALEARAEEKARLARLKQSLS
jgi:allophanate hydrolase subunit 2